MQPKTMIFLKKLILFLIICTIGYFIIQNLMTPKADIPEFDPDIDMSAEYVLE